MGALPVNFLRRPPPFSFSPLAGEGDHTSALQGCFLFAWLALRWPGYRATQRPACLPDFLEARPPYPHLRQPPAALEGLSARGALRGAVPYLPARGLPYSWGFVI